MPDQRVPRHRLRHLRKTNHQLDNLRIMSACLEAFPDSTEEPGGGPGDLLGTLDDARVAREERGEQRGEEVVE
jgi:hypothetical protein